ncbi:MAG: HEPN domain-containing protein [Candidatus Paceibacteria bacterium]
MKNKQLLKDWLQEADKDKKSATALVENEMGAPSTAYYLSQQIVEKSLKAFLAYHNEEPPKIHQLDRLLELCSDVDSEFDQFLDTVIKLNDYYMETRYVEFQEGSYSFNKAEELLSDALKIKEFVEEKALSR